MFLLRAEVHPQPPEESPVDPGLGVQVPARLGREQREGEPPEEHDGGQGLCDAQCGPPALPREAAPYVRVWRLVEVGQQSAKETDVSQESKLFTGGRKQREDQQTLHSIKLKVAGICSSQTGYTWFRVVVSESLNCC